MRLRVTHQTNYAYEVAARGAIQLLRVTPRNHNGQHVSQWRIDVNQDCNLAQFDDAFGNVVHIFTLDRPVSALQIAVTGEVETHDTHGVVAGTMEPFPPSLFLRETPLTAADPALTTFARKVGASGAGNALKILHALTAALRETITFDTAATDATTPAAQAFDQRRGVCQDFAHIFIAAARQFDIPARYIAGHLMRTEGLLQQTAGHAWAEAYVDDLGWVAFDPANGISATDAYVRVAAGLDSVGAAPVRGTVFGGGHESLSVAVTVEQVKRSRRQRPQSDQ